MYINRLFADYVNVLKAQNGILTEDNVRYYLFAKMLDQDSDLRHYALELPYKELAGNSYPVSLISKHNLNLNQNGKLNQELDMYYCDNNECLCIEVKFHRVGDISSTYAHTDAAGSLFNDMRRLSVLTPSGSMPVKKYFLYVTDYEMDKYLRGSGNATQNKMYRDELRKFYEFNPCQGIIHIDFLNTSAPGTFKSTASKSFEEPAKMAPCVDVLQLYCDTIISFSKSIEVEKYSGQRQCVVKLYEVI